MVTIEVQPHTPWLLRLAGRVPALLLGLLIGLFVFCVFLLYTSLFGDGLGQLAAIGFANAWLAELVQDLFLGFAVAVIVASARGARTDLEALRPALSPSLRDATDLFARTVPRPHPLQILTTLVAVVASIATVESPRMWADGRMPHWTHASVLWLFARNCLAWSIALRGMALELLGAWLFSRLADSIETVDLFERDVFVPFVRRALRGVLLWMLLAAWVGLNFAGRGWAVPKLAGLGITALAVFAVAAFVLPLLGPHRRLRDAKAIELARVHVAIRALRERVLTLPADELSGGRLADLLGYESRVAASSAWPVAASTMLRFVFYVALGLGSWIGAGVVQYGVESALR